MPRYDKTLSRRVARALELADGDLREAFDRAEDLGITRDAFERLLLEDLMDDGPIFGKLKSNLMGAAEQSILAAQEQGLIVGEAIQSAAFDFEEMTEEQIDRMLAGEDPAAMMDVESRMDDVDYTWVAMLVNSCPYCVALHGTTMSKAEWKDSGHHPETIHNLRGINAPCWCQFVLAEAAKKDDLSTAEPLRRVSVESRKGTKGNRRTIRKVAQRDPDKALAAVEEALKTDAGRASLRAMGNAAPEEVAKPVREARAEAREDREK